MSLPPSSTPVLDRLLDRLTRAALFAAGVLLVAVVVHLWVTPLPPGVLAWERPLLLSVAGILAVTEAVRAGRWGARGTTRFRWSRPLAGFVGLAAVLLVRLLPIEQGGRLMSPLLGVGCGMLSISLGVDLWVAHRSGSLSRRQVTQLGAGTLGLALLAVLTGAEAWLPNRLWLVGFVVMLPLLAVGGLAANRLRDTQSSSGHSQPSRR